MGQAYAKLRAQQQDTIQYLPYRVSESCVLKKEVGMIFSYLFEQYEEYTDIEYFNNDQHSLIVTAKRKDCTEDICLRILKWQKAKQEKFGKQNLEENSLRQCCNSVIRRSFILQKIIVSNKYDPSKSSQPSDEIENDKIYFVEELNFDGYKKSFKPFCYQGPSDLSIIESNFQYVLDLRGFYQPKSITDKKEFYKIAAKVGKCFNIESLDLSFQFQKNIQLYFLRNIHIGSLCSSLFNAIQNCRYLQNLNLNFRNSFSVREISQLNKAFEACNKIVNLKISFQYYRGDEEGLFGEGLSKLQNLQTLCLQQEGQFFDNNEPNFLIKGISKCQLLRDLTLDWSSCNISDKKAQSISEDFEHLQNVKQLRINWDGNSLKRLGICQILSGLSKLKNLEELSCVFNCQHSSIEEYQEEKEQFKNNTLPIVPIDLGEELKNLTNLKKLYLRFRQIHYFENQAIGISRSLPFLLNLRDLSLSFSSSDVTPFGAKIIFLELSKCKELTSLNLNFNCSRFNEDVGVEFGKSLKKLTKLKSIYLDLWCCDFKDRGIKKILTGIRKMTQLTSLFLNIRWNYLTHRISSSFTKFFKKLPRLESVSLLLNVNSIDYGVQEIVYSLRQLPYLSYLGLDLRIRKIIQFINLNSMNKQINSEVAISIFDDISNCQKLKFLRINLRECKISNDATLSIINSLSKLKKLHDLSLSLKENQLQNLSSMYNLIKKQRQLTKFEKDFEFF